MALFCTEGLERAMIWGIIHKDLSHHVSRDALSLMSKQAIGDWDFYRHRNVGLAWENIFPGECSLYRKDSKAISVIFQGAIYNADELKKSLNEEGTLDTSAELLAILYTRYGEKCVERIWGKFAFVIWDGANHLAILGRDRVGIEPLFYSEKGDKILFGSSPFFIVQHPDVRKNLDFEAIHQFLLYCYNPSFSTFFKGIQKLRPGHLLLNRDGTSMLHRYWNLSFASQESNDEIKLRERLLDLMREAVRVRLAPHRTLGIYVSGGMDSSTILALASEDSDQSIHAFSYRCRGESFEESHYAKKVADHYHTEQTLIDYSPEDVESLVDLVTFMDEPFCDVGINLATELLGRASSGKVDYVLTGDGGDELFGGHPVYMADRAGLIMDRIPGVIRNPFLWMGSRLRDSQKKKDFRVKWKRFSMNVRFPSSLLSHRWRVYYAPDEMTDLINPDFLELFDTTQPYESILSINAEADGQTFLDRALYSDYNTVVGFYLRRMDLIRHHGIESRFPLLDHRLIEYCAAIAPDLKIRRASETKYILKKTMNGILPDEIVFRKGKLGHSIPLKNWMRDHSRVKAFMMDLLSQETMNKRHIFNGGTVAKYIQDHLSCKRNNSHRLWALMVLELWLQKHWDG